MEILTNNMLVLVIYVGVGLLVKGLTGSRLAPLAPWVVFFAHLGQIIMEMCRHVGRAGLLPCLALTLPHGCLEMPGLTLACLAGTRLVRGKKAMPQLLAASALICLGAWVETRVTPFPFGAWL